MLDSDQRVLGEMFVTLLEHKSSISELTLEEWNNLHEIMLQLERAVSTAFQPSHFNWSCLMNNAAVADQPTHVHWHCHPRFKVPVDFAGEVFRDTELYPPKERTIHFVSDDMLHTVADAIRSHL